MEFHQLRYFVAAGEEGSMSRAAQRENVSQPALSRQIRLLEEELSLALFDRIRQRIYLTEAGRFFLVKARQLLCDTELSMQQTREKFGGARRTVRLGFLSPFLDDLIAPVVREFQQRHSGSKVSLFDLPPSGQVARLKRRELDLCILANVEESERRQFDVTVLSRHRFVAVLPEDHRLAGRKKIRLNELEGDEWISLSDALFPGRRAFLNETCLRAGFSPVVVKEAESLPLMLAEIGMREGVGIMPGHARKLPHSGCVILPFDSPTIRSELLLMVLDGAQDAEILALKALLKERAAVL